MFSIGEINHHLTTKLAGELVLARSATRGIELCVFLGEMQMFSLVLCGNKGVIPHNFSGVLDQKCA